MLVGSCALAAGIDLGTWWGRAVPVRVPDGAEPGGAVYGCRTLMPIGVNQ